MGGKSKKVTVGYWYYATLKAGLALKLDEIFEIKAGDKVAFNSRINKNQGNKSIFINNPYLFGGEKAEGGIQGSLEVRWGAENQQPSGLLKLLLGNDIPADRGYVSTVFDGKLTALNPYPKPWTYSVRRYTSSFYPEKSAIILADNKIYAMNPAHMLWESYTDEDWGSGLPAVAMDEVAFKRAADKLYEEKFGLCLAWKVSDELKTFRQQICDHIGAKVFTSRNGLITIKLIRDDYNVDELSVFDESKGLLKLDYDATNNTAVPSKVVVTYKDATTFKDRPAMAVNLAVVQSQGNQSVQPIEFKGLPTGELADRVAHRELKIRTSSLKRYNLEFDRRAFELDIGDPFVLRSLDRKINTIVRVERVEESFLTDGTIKITAIQDLYGLPKAAYNSIPPIENTDPDDTPVAIDQYKLIEVPYRELAGLIDPANLELLDATSSYFFVVAASPKGTCRNYNLASRIRGNTDFVIAEPAGDWCPTATIVNELDYLDKTITVADGMLLEDVEKGTAAIINDEIVRIDAIDLVNNKITIARGCVDTVPHKHPANSKIWFYDSFETSDYIEYNPGLSIDFKLLSNTYSGQLEISKAPTETIISQSRQGRPYPPGNMKIDGANYPVKVNSNPINITWSSRNRLLHADQLIDTTMGDMSSEVGTTYNLRAYLNNELIINENKLENNQYNLVVAGGAGDIAVLTLDDITDKTGRVWTSSGNAQFDINNTIEGDASLKLAGSSWLQTIDTSGFAFRQGDFTLEAWVKLSTVNGRDRIIIDNFYNTKNVRSYQMNVGSNGRLSFYYYNNGGKYAYGITTLTDDQWHHVAVTRANSILRLFVDGNLETTVANHDLDYDAITNVTAIGAQVNNRNSNYDFIGNIDQVRVTRGLARYTEDFTPTTLPYEAEKSIDGVVRIELESVRDDLISYQTHSHSFNFSNT